MNSRERCPCGSGQTYRTCCGPYHDGGAAPTAEALMGSRYTAYVLGLWAYLRQTWHPSTRPKDLTADPEPAAWHGLSIKHQGCLDDDHAMVEFVARYKVNGRAHRLHEISRFVRVDDRWFYLDGRFPEP